MPSRVELLDAIDETFGESDLQELCFLLGIDYANLEGPTKRAKVRALILYHEQRRQMPALAKAVVEARPFLEPAFREWLEAPVDKSGRLVAAADALRQLIAEGGTLNRTQTDTLRRALATLKDAPGKGRPPDAQALRNVADLTAAARLSPADLRRAERLLRELGVTHD